MADMGRRQSKRHSEQPVTVRWCLRHSQSAHRLRHAMLCLAPCASIHCPLGSMPGRKGAAANFHTAHSLFKAPAASSWGSRLYMQGPVPARQASTQLSTPNMARQPCSGPTSGLARHRQRCCVTPMHLCHMQPGKPEPDLKPAVSHTLIQLCQLTSFIECLALLPLPQPAASLLRSAASGLLVVQRLTCGTGRRSQRQRRPPWWTAPRRSRGRPPAGSARTRCA